jgi:hypothetical protein
MSCWGGPDGTHCGVAATGLAAATQLREAAPLHYAPLARFFLHLVYPLSYIIIIIYYYLKKFYINLMIKLILFKNI